MLYQTGFGSFLQFVNIEQVADIRTHRLPRSGPNLGISDASDRPRLEEWVDEMDDENRNIWWDNELKCCAQIEF